MNKAERANLSFSPSALVLEPIEKEAKGQIRKNSRKQNLCQPTRRADELTNSVMILAGQETDFQEKFDLGQLNRKESSRIKKCQHGSSGMLILR